MSKWQDQRNFLSKLSVPRVANASRILGSYYQSRLNQQPKISGLPISLSVEPTTACNLRCPECPSGLRSFSRPTGKLPMDLYRQVIDELQETLLYLLLYFQGEPYLHPQFLELVEQAARKNIYTATSTNAHFLHDEAARQTVASGLDRLIISIDGTTQETYQSYRIGGKLDKVLEGANNVVRWKRKLRSRTPHIIFQILVVRPNEHQIEEVKQLAEQVGVDEVKFKTAQIYDYQQGSPLIPTQEKYARYRQRADGSYTIKNKLLDHCWKMWHSCVMTWDGRIVPCCFDKDAHHVLGSVQDSSFREVWYGEAYRQFRAQLLKSRQQIDICQNCTEGTKVWA
ncbi:MAG: SPASM domain-containing protein [Cyclobacteriaceae bacterium]